MGNNNSVSQNNAAQQAQRAQQARQQAEAAQHAKDAAQHAKDEAAQAQKSRAKPAPKAPAKPAAQAAKSGANKAKPSTQRSTVERSASTIQAVSQARKAVTALGGQKAAVAAMTDANGHHDATTTKLLGQVTHAAALLHAGQETKPGRLTEADATAQVAEIVQGPVLTASQMEAIKTRAAALQAAAAKAGAVDGWTRSNAEAAIGQKGPAKTYTADPKVKVSTTGQASAKNTNTGGTQTANAGSLKFTGSSSMGGTLYNVGDVLAAQKKKILDELKKLGIDPKSAEGKEILAIAMMETQHMLNSEHDGSKSGASANFGLFNMNTDLLSKFCGVSSGAAMNALNEPGNIAGNIKAIATGIKNMGISDFVNSLRAGNPNSGDQQVVKDYKNAMMSTMAAFTKDPTLMTNGQRLGFSVDHI
jgi:hypothetical protein